MQTRVQGVRYNINKFLGYIAFTYFDDTQVNVSMQLGGEVVWGKNSTIQC